VKCCYCLVDFTPRRRKFARLGAEYPICAKCGKAQRFSSSLKVRGRGTRAPEREELRKKIAMGLRRYDAKVLVWGPSPNSPDPASEKRKQIKAELKRNENQAYFSEELGVRENLPSKILELIQLKAVDLVIDVDHSPGSAAEFESFGIQLGPKMLLWFPKSGRGGFVDTGNRRLFRAAGGFDEAFDESDLASCVLTLASVDWVKEKKYLQLYVDEAKAALERVAPLG
jgi:hypothetical protein